MGGKPSSIMANGNHSFTLQSKMNNTCILSHNPPVMCTVLTDKKEITEKIKELKSYGFRTVYSGITKGIEEYSKYFKHKHEGMYNLYDSYLNKEDKEYSFTPDFKECLHSIEKVLELEMNYIILSITK